MLVWHLTRGEGKEYGVPRRSLKGHSHFVQDVVISSDGQFALSGSWDGTLRLWDLNTGTTTRRFIGHTKDVLSVAFSVDNRQVLIGTIPNPSVHLYHANADYFIQYWCQCSTAGMHWLHLQLTGDRQDVWKLGMVQSCAPFDLVRRFVLDLYWGHTPVHSGFIAVFAQQLSEGGVTSASE